jgi:serine/threonine protein kinase
MDSERWRHINDLYHSALEREPERRAAFLAEACEGDNDLRREIDLLLLQSDSTGGVVGRPVWQVVAEAAEQAERVTEGARLGPYEILGPLGEGGMGRVYRGLDTRLGRIVAIKISAEQFGARFEREARAIASLNHAHVCTLYDVGLNYLVMELVDGETLAQQIDRLGALPLVNVLDIGLQVAEALQAAHSKGIVHRDLLFALAETDIRTSAQ